MHDLIIIGAGPAGLSAAIYASRAELDYILIEENFVNGGQIIDTYEIDNYPGLPGLSGMDLAQKMADHLKNWAQRSSMRQWRAWSSRERSKK